MKRAALPLSLLLASVAVPAASMLGLEAIGQENSPRGGAVIREGYSYLNPALLAWEDKTSFSAVLAFDQDFASNGGSAISSESFGVPSMSMAIPMGFLGSIGLGLHQHYTSDAQIESGDSAHANEVRLDYQGSIFEVAPAYAWRLPGFLRDFSLGVNYRFLFGSIKRSLTMQGSSDGLAEADAWAFSQTELTDRAEGNWEAAGAAWKRLGGSMHWHRKNVDYYLGYAMPYQMRRDMTYNLQYSNTDTLQPAHAEQFVDMPGRLSTGMHVRFGQRHNASLEFTQQAFDGSMSLLAGNWALPDSAEVQTQRNFSAEYELEGSGLYYDSFWKRNSYRLGAWYKEWYLADVSELGANLGMGLPLGRRGTRLDVSVQGGLRDGGASSAWDETFWGIRLGFTGVGSWGQKSRRY